MTFERTGVHIVAAVTGTGTGLGHFTEVLDYVLAYDFVNFAGGGSITAADGSQLFLSFSGAIPGFAAQVFPLPYSAAYTIAPTATVRQRHASAFSAASDDSSIRG